MTFPRAFIFDMDGTMVDNMGHHAQAWVQAFHEAGHDVDNAEFIRVMGGRTATSLIREYVGADLDPADVEKLIERKEILYRTLYHPDREPAPGLLELLNAAQARGIRSAVASSARRGNIDFILDGLDLRKYFHVVVSAEDVKRHKPDPEMFLVAAKAMEVPPAECWVFEDATAGLDAARAAGMPAILVAFDEQTEKLLSHPAVTRVIHSFAEVKV